MQILARKFKAFAVWGLPLVAGLALGCGGSDGDTGSIAVSGGVTLEGEPVKNGVVVFTPASTELRLSATALTARGQIQDGKYSLNAVPGEHRVDIVVFSTTPAAPEGIGSPGEQSGGETVARAIKSATVGNEDMPDVNFELTATDRVGDTF
jgi:hypothetical protein